MDENSRKIEQLLQKIDILSRRQQGFYQEISKSSLIWDISEVRFRLK